MSNAADAQ